MARSLPLTAIVNLGLALAAARAWALPALQPDSPIDGSEITDVATYFKWAPVSGCSRWEIQIATDPGFARLARSAALTDAKYYYNAYFPKTVLPPGNYWWRVRGVAGGTPGPWSRTRSVKVNDAHPIAPELALAIGPDHPVFFMRNREWDPEPAGNRAHVREIIPPGFEGTLIPDDIKMASNVGDGALARARAYESLGLRFTFWDNRAQTPLSLVEYVFQHFPHCVGLAEGEHFSGWGWEKGPEGDITDETYVTRAWALCAKYGKFYVHGEGEGSRYDWTSIPYDHRQEYALYRRNILPMFKTTINSVAPHTYGAVEGLLASGYVDNVGLWGDEFNWRGSGFGPEPDPPWAYMVQHWLVSIAGGGTVFHLESAHQWTGNGSGSAGYVRTYLPFVEAVVRHGLIPSRKAFLDSLKVAVSCDYASAKLQHHGSLDPSFSFLNTLYGLGRAPIQEMIPDNGRYGVICLLPPGAKCLNPDARIVARADLDPAQALRIFNQAYPARFRGTAFMWECDGRFIAMNRHEDSAADDAFDMALACRAAFRVSGILNRHKFLIGRIENGGASLFAHVDGGSPSLNTASQNAYTPSVLRFSAAAEPVLSVSPPSALIARAWDNGILSVTLSHDQGAVDLTLRDPNGDAVKPVPGGASGFSLEGREGAVSYRVPDGDRARVRISLYDPMGRERAVLVDADIAPGRHDVALGPTGLALGKGTYFCRMQAPGFRAGTEVQLLASPAGR